MMYVFHRIKMMKLMNIKMSEGSLYWSCYLFY